MNAKVADEVKKHFRIADSTISLTGVAKKLHRFRIWLQVRDLHPKSRTLGPQVRDPGPGPGRSRSRPLCKVRQPMRCQLSSLKHLHSDKYSFTHSIRMASRLLVVACAHATAPFNVHQIALQFASQLSLVVPSTFVILVVSAMCKIT